MIHPRYALTIVVMSAVSCGPSPVALEGGKYSVGLEECSRTASNLCESIACENDLRAKSKRPLRTVPAHCKPIQDAGGE